MEEFWSSPSENLILGTTRYLRGDRTVSFEFSRIEIEEGEVILTPYPNGRPSADGFRLTSLEPGVAVFEAPEHDFPRRIIYRDEPGGVRVARIDDGTDDGEAREWRLRQVTCPGVE